MDILTFAFSLIALVVSIASAASSKKAADSSKEQAEEFRKQNEIAEKTLRIEQEKHFREMKDYSVEAMNKMFPTALYRAKKEGRRSYDGYLREIVKPSLRSYVANGILSEEFASQWLANLCLQGELVVQAPEACEIWLDQETMSIKVGFDSSKVPNDWEGQVTIGFTDGTSQTLKFKPVEHQ